MPRRLAPDPSRALSIRRDSLDGDERSSGLPCSRYRVRSIETVTLHLEKDRIGRCRRSTNAEPQG